MEPRAPRDLAPEVRSLKEIVADMMGSLVKNLNEGAVADEAHPKAEKPVEKEPEK
jgi:hypothetical protein